MNLAERLAAIQADPRFDGHPNPVYLAVAMQLAPAATPEEADRIAADLEPEDASLLRACTEIGQGA